MGYLYICLLIICAELKLEGAVIPCIVGVLFEFAKSVIANIKRLENEENDFYK